MAFFFECFSHSILYCYLHTRHSQDIKRFEYVPQKKQIVSTARSAKAWPEESANGQNIDGWPKSHQCHNGEDTQTATHCHRTISKFTHRPDGYSESGRCIPTPRHMGKWISNFKIFVVFAGKSILHSMHQIEWPEDSKQIRRCNCYQTGKNRWKTYKKINPKRWYWLCWCICSYDTPAC